MSLLSARMRALAAWYLAANRWWLPLLCGCLFLPALPPFNHTTHWSLALCPLLSFVVLVPLFAFATQPSLKRAILHSQLYGMMAAACQLYWIVFDTAEGVWHLIILGVLGLCVLFGLYYLAMGMLLRLARRLVPSAAVFVFPAAWVVVEYLRTLGDLSFPWMLIGYALGPYLALAQVASVGGVYLLSLLVVFANVLLWQCGRELARGRLAAFTRRLCIGAAALLVAAAAWGMVRIAGPAPAGASARFACLQPNLDHLHHGGHALDSAFAVAERLTYVAAAGQPDCIVMPESALLCYLGRRPELATRVLRWRDSVRVPLVLGSLQWEHGGKGSVYKYRVYNAAYLVDTGRPQMRLYYKMRLVPFSEALPFEGLFPILSRVNLGEADFAAGRSPTVFALGPGVRAAPLICYEIIYPAFVRKRLALGANVLLNITNDGWFGRTPGPFQHAVMSQMRCIEDGVSLARCANTGISMLVDPLGRVLGRTRLCERTVLAGSVPLDRVPTLYARWGDWVVWVSVLVLCAAGAWAACRRLRRQAGTPP